MAGGFGSSSDEEIISGINVTPLVDVVLVLLIIFLITAPVLFQSAIKVELPRAKSGEQANKSPLNFTIDRSGKLHWEKEKIDWATLESRLAKMAKQAPHETAIISADQGTPH